MNHTGRYDPEPPPTGLTRWEIAQVLAGGVLMFGFFLAIVFFLAVFQPDFTPTMP